MKYDRGINQLLDVYRFFSFGIAVLLIQVLPMLSGEETDNQTYLLLTIFGIYTLLKVFAPIRWWQKDPMTYVVLFGDLTVCIFLVLFTGGLNSGFLLYSLIPVITAALLFEERVAIITAAFASLSLVVAHVGLSRFSSQFGWIMRDNNLPQMIMYIITCFLIATVTYRANFNIKQRIQTDAILEERRRIKSEIHDGVAQALGYLNLKTKLVEELVSSNIMDRAIEGLADIGKVVRETYENIRESIDQLSTEAETFNLDSALPNYVKEFSGNTGIQVRFETSAEIQKISPVAGLQLMRIVQEALTNVRKHAGAKHVQVRLQHDQRNIVLTVKDDGQGFEKVPGENQESQGGSHGLTIMNERTESLGGSHGLTIMNERTESLGGTFSIVSTEGGGTEVTVCFPLEKVRI